MRLPDFLCVGAAKAGTTTIHEMLAGHSSIWMPPAKELHFFDNDEHYAAGPEWYAQAFQHAPDDALVGEVTPAYMSYETTAERIVETLGADTRLIFSLREPVARAYSEFQHNLRRGYVDGHFEDALEWESARHDLTRWQRRHYSFVSRGRYAEQIQRFLALIPRDRMLFLIVEEDLGDQLPATLNRLQDFLGVVNESPARRQTFNESYRPRSMAVQRWLFTDGPLRKALRRIVRSQAIRTTIRRKVMKVNSSARKPEKLTMARRKALQDKYFSDDIAALQELLQRDLSCWSID